MTVQSLPRPGAGAFPGRCDLYGQQVAWNQIWRNFCVSDTYEPGSPSRFLPYTGLEGVLKGNESFECTGYLHVGDYDIKCTAWRRAPRVLNFRSLMQSCNVAIMRMEP